MKNNLVNGIARSLVQHAARRAPESLAERLEEEWLADFAERQSQLARLRFGVGCVWATHVIAHEYLEPKVAAATAGSGAVATSSQHAGVDLSFVSGRTVAVLGITGLHGLIVWAFATGLVQKVVVMIDPAPVVIKDERRVVDRPPPLPPPTDLEHMHKVSIPTPDFPIDFENVATTFVIPDVKGPPDVPTTPVTQPPPVKRVQGGPGKGFPNTDDYYPPHEIRTGTQGTAAVTVCTDEKGRLTAEPTLAKTSGSAGLDQGALRLAKAGSGHYRATLEDGRAVSSCYPFLVTFSIRN
ncbi:MAG: energy transducer TonB [Proteobacteria bacterium]|nr:energy transducer TonB [Pseudomonadota bacterium]